MSVEAFPAASPPAPIWLAAREVPARLGAAPRLIGRDQGGSLPRLRIRLTKGGDALAPGDWFTVRAFLLPPPAPAMPGAYDFQRQAFFDRLGGVGYAVGPGVRIEPPAG